MSGTGIMFVWLAWLCTLLLYFRADRQRRDLLTDMCQLAHDDVIERDDLRRARDIPELERRFDD